MGDMEVYFLRFVAHACRRPEERFMGQQGLIGMGIMTIKDDLD
jgi:hypothetical protein